MPRNVEQTRQADSRRETFKNRLVFPMVFAKTGSVKLSDEQVATLTGVSVRQARRYLAYWKQQGVFKTTTQRVKHSLGWCNNRIISVDEITLIQARHQFEVHGRLL